MASARCGDAHHVRGKGSRRCRARCNTHERIRMHLTRAQRERFDEDGYLVVEGVLRDHDFGTVYREYGQLLEDRLACWGRPSPSATSFDEALIEVVGSDGFSLPLLGDLDI